MNSSGSATCGTLSKSATGWILNMNTSQSATGRTPNTNASQSATAWILNMNTLQRVTGTCRTPNMNASQSTTGRTPNMNASQNATGGTPNMSTSQSATGGTPNMNASKSAAGKTPSMNLSDCAMCKTPFVKIKGPKTGYGRHTLRHFTTPRTAEKFCGGPVCMDNVVCGKCSRDIVKNTVMLTTIGRKTGQKIARRILKSEKILLRKSKAQKKPRPQKVEGGDGTVPSTSAIPMEIGDEVQDWSDMEQEETQESQNSSRPLKKKPKNRRIEDDPLDKAITCLSEGRFSVGLRALCKVSARAKQALITVVAEIIKKEINSYPKINAFQQEVTHSAVSSFSWVKAMEEAQESLPTTVSCIWAMLPFKKGKPKSDVVRKAVHMLNIALYTRSRGFNFVQSSVGMELLKKRASRKVFTTLNRMAISTAYAPARHHLDEIGKQHEQELLNWKKYLESTPSQESYGFSYSRIFLGFKAKTTCKSNPQTVCFAVKDRVHTKRAVKSREVQVPASELDPYTFLPSPEVFARRRSRAVFLVKHLITKHLTKVQHLKGKMPSRILHSHTKEMDEKSQCVTPSIVDANPGSTQGMISVLERLQNYVPVKDGKPMPCLLIGDIEPIQQAQGHACSDGGNGNDRLVAFRACPQESRKDVHHIKESNKKFFKASSLTERGTVAQMKDRFKLRPFKNDTTESFPRTWDLYEFVTEAHILMCAMKLCGMTSLEDQPEGCPRQKSHVRRQFQWLTNLAHRVVDFCWFPPDRGDVQVAAASFDEKLKDVEENVLRYCYCNTHGKSDDMVLCHAKTCEHAWFHLECVGLDKAPNSEDDWYCSKECENSGSYIYCFCHMKQPAGVNMVQCHLADQCKKYVWYHQDCVSTSTDAPLPETWYCSEECALGAENDDHVLNHTKALMYEGLCHLIRRQAVSEGNGPAMVDDWKADMLNFHEWDRKGYLAIGHCFLACVGGFADPELRDSFIWNRVANPSGKPGANIGLEECVTLDYQGSYGSWNYTFLCFRP
ncbi:uncharacterized protein LOC135156975 [Lytechinus pictus]|uniref:uncharacterized protein LOC135156975 n=1 Tax=Lytechinus pictus TaxID=7653 RepID=UPI0030B9B5A1